MNRRVEREGPDSLNKVFLVPDSHSMLMAFVVNFELALSKRVFSTWFVWRQESDDHLAHMLCVCVALLTNVCGPQSARSRTSSRRKPEGVCPER